MLFLGFQASGTRNTDDGHPPDIRNPDCGFRAKLKIKFKFSSLDKTLKLYKGEINITTKYSFMKCNLLLTRGLLVGQSVGLSVIIS